MNFFTNIKKWIASLPLSIYIIKKSKATSLPGFRKIPLYDVVNFFVAQLNTVGIQERAASIAFNFIMAIPPAIIFLFTLIPFFPISDAFEQNLFNLIRDVVPGEKNNSVLIGFLKDFINNPRTGLLSIGFILSMFFSSNAIIGIMRSFDKNYIGFKKRSDFKKRLIAIQITLVLFAFVLLSSLLLAGQGVVLEWLGIKNYTIRAIIVNTRWIIVVFLFFGCISYIFRHAPAVHKKWKMINPGSIVATFLMLAFTLAFSWWVSRFGDYNQIYGSISTIMILMLLIFVNSLVLLIGFELNVSITSLKKIADERKDSEADGIDKPE